MKLIYAGTPDFAVPPLEALLNAGYVPELVLTQPDRPSGRGQRLQPPPVKRVALERGLEVRQPAKLGDVRAELERIQPDALMVVAYAHKIPNWLLGLPRFGCLNVHPSLLPRYRGSSPVAAALLNGDRETGVSIMRLDQGWDTGPVLSVRTLPIGAFDNEGSLSRKLANLGAELLLEVLANLEHETATLTEQDHDRATYAPKLKKEDGRLDWSKPAARLVNEVRAYTPWPGSFTTWKGRTLKVLQARAEPAGEGRQPGLVGEHLAVATGDGMLVLERVQMEGRRPVTAGEFLAGQRDIVGDRLG